MEEIFHSLLDKETRNQSVCMLLFPTDFLTTSFWETLMSVKEIERMNIEILSSILWNLET